MCGVQAVLVFGGFTLGPLWVDGLRVVLVPDDVVLLYHLVGLVAQEYEAVVVHSYLYVFSSCGRKKKGSDEFSLTQSQ